jgi:tetratricopeptide (TPR) repeat protein
VLSSLLKHILDGARARRAARRVEGSAAELDRARSLQASGDSAGARAACEGILSRSPQDAGAHCVLGMACGAGGEFDLAFEHLAQAARLNPTSHEAHFGLGNVHWMRRDIAAAAECYRRALALNPASAETHFNLGMVLRFAAQLQDAASHFERAVALAPAFREAAKECALTQTQLGLFDAALKTTQDALRHAPAAGDLHATLGLVHQQMHQPQAALECYDRAGSLGHADAELWCNRGRVLQELGRIPEALDAYDRAIALQHEFPLARFHRALARLLAGDYAAGWSEYEARLVSEEHPRRPDGFPRWDGSPLTGRTVLVYGEQGLGDELMFASCLPEVVEQAGRCVIECNPKLERLFRQSFPRAVVYAAEPGHAVPRAIRSDAIDCEVAIGSLPLHLRRSPADFRPHRGYLSADARRVVAWRERLASLGTGLKVGISWRGGTHVSRSPLRSIPLAQWLPIFDAAPAQFVSLQYHDCADELNEFSARHGRRVVHWQEAIDDYEETAALVCALDIVVSVCTAVIHLGGALGRPVWIMVPYSPEWRYGSKGEGMPWYPSVRLFRQDTFGKWPPVIAAVARELQALEGRRRNG